MKLIQDVLKACGYFEAPPFSLADPNDEQDHKGKNERLVTPFLSEAASGETYLVISVSRAELPHLLDSDFMASIMLALGRQKFYSPDMDRNTTLLLLCRREEGEQIDHNAKVQIEDDPYYFKKYVLVYTEQEKAAALAYIDGQQDSLQEIIRSCLMNAALFSEYKNHIAQDRKPADAGEKKTARGRKKAAAEPESTAPENPKTPDHLAYGFFAELAAKITVLSIRPSSSAAITSIDKYWEEELQKRPRIDLTALNSLVNIVPDKDTDRQKLKADEILDRWRRLTERKCD